MNNAKYHDDVALFLIENEMAFYGKGAQPGAEIVSMPAYAGD